MKKIVALGVLLVLLSTVIFAQDDDSGWKVGFRAQLTRDFFYSTKAKANSETKNTTSPADPSDGTYTTTLGDYYKGSSNLFTFTDGYRPDNRLIISLSNNGEHHSVYMDMHLEKDWVNGFTFMNLLSGGAADWWFAGDTGASEAKVVFDGKVGSGRYGGFVPVFEIWDDYIQEGGYNFFGVVTKGGFLASDNISASAINGNPWETVYALGATFGGNIRFAFGSTLGSFFQGNDDPFASASSVQAGFMLSGKGIADLLSFDLFYAINGGDSNTVARGTGEWDNILGVYLGIDGEKIGIGGLGLSVGFTAKFTKTETGQVQTNPLYDSTYDGTVPANKPKYEAYETSNPLWSGVDINISFSGIEKVGITFDNNLSFASASGNETKSLTDDVIIGLDGSRLNPLIGLLDTDKYEIKQSWFAYKASLSFSFAVSDNLSVTLGLRNMLTIFSEESNYAAGGLSTYKHEGTSKRTEDRLRASLHADYNIGNVGFGIGLNLGIVGISIDSEGKATYTGGSDSSTFSGSLSRTVFSVPLFFKVAI